MVTCLHLERQKGSEKGPNGPRQVLAVRGWDSLTHSILKQYLFLSMNPDQLSHADRKAFREAEWLVPLEEMPWKAQGLLGPLPLFSLLLLFLL